MANRSGEFAYIDWIRNQVKPHSSLTVGIGDDTAMLRLSDKANCLLATDMLMEGVHFTLDSASPREIGRKALAVNLSDIAAMAGSPQACLVSVALPRQSAKTLPFELHEGIQQLADEFDVAVAGGDTNSWDGPLVINIAVIGQPTANGPVLRSGAQSGDWIMVTGELGGSLAGKQFSFQPRVGEAIQIHQAVTLHAMIDVSDGLAADLHHILEESHVGAELFATRIPISETVRSLTDERSPLQHALRDGEDFELLFTVSPGDGQNLLANSSVNVQLTHIGTITVATDCFLIEENGNRVVLPPLGWEHSV